MELKDLLQVNATIIAGLLILLTIQTVNEEIRPLADANDWQKQINELEVEQYALNKTVAKLLEIAPAVTDKERSDELKTRILDLSNELQVVSYKLEKMRNTSFKIIDENNEVITLDQELSKPSFTKAIQTYGIVMLIPFVASSILCVSIEFAKEEKRLAKQKTILTAKILTFLGFFIILISLVIFNYFIQI